MPPSCTPPSTRPPGTPISSSATWPGTSGTSFDPLPGKTHDAKGIRDTGLTGILGAENAIGDKGYLGTGITTPYRKPAGGRLLDWQKEFNTTINEIRYVIERAIANFKTWRSMHSDYRRPRHTYATAFRTTATEEWLSCGVTGGCCQRVVGDQRARHSSSSGASPVGPGHLTSNALLGSQSDVRPPRILARRRIQGESRLSTPTPSAA